MPRRRSSPIQRYLRRRVLRPMRKRKEPGERSVRIQQMGRQIRRIKPSPGRVSKRERTAIRRGAAHAAPVRYGFPGTDVKGWKARKAYKQAAYRKARRS